MYKTETVELSEKEKKSEVHQFSECIIKDGMYGEIKQVKIVDKESNKIIETKESFVPAGGAVYVEEIEENIDTLEVMLKLYFTKGEEKKVIYFPRGDLVDTKVLTIASYGVQVTKQTSALFIKSIMNQEINAQRILTYEKLGFSEYKGRKLFKGCEAIGIEAKYTGQLRVSPKGSYDTYKGMIEREVKGQTALEFILAVSISGMLVDFLKDRMSLENVVVHLVGQSSTGKTTSALLAVASGSAPDFKGDNFVFSFQDTQNSLMRLIPSSYPTLIDEGSLIGKKDMTQAMYSLSSGVEKRRMTKNLETQEVSKFKTAIILTSEKSILNQCNENSGLLVRNIEIDNEVFTKSAESADRIKNIIKNNYGFLVEKTAQYLLDKGEEKIGEMVSRETHDLIKKAKENKEYNNLTERSAKQTALILASVDILKEVLSINFDKSSINEFMHKHSLIKDEESVSLGRRAMDYLLQIISKDYTLFIREEGAEIRNCKGKIKKIPKKLLKTGEESTKKLLITREEFVNLLQQGLFSEEKIILKEWKELGYLQSQKDRYISKISIIQGIETKGYAIYLPSQEKETIVHKPKSKKEDFDFEKEDEIDFED